MCQCALVCVYARILCRIMFKSERVSEKENLPIKEYNLNCNDNGGHDDDNDNDSDENLLFRRRHKGTACVCVCERVCVVHKACSDRARVLRFLFIVSSEYLGTRNTATPKWYVYVVLCALLLLLLVLLLRPPPPPSSSLSTPSHSPSKMWWLHSEVNTLHMCLCVCVYMKYK